MSEEELTLNDLEPDEGNLTPDEPIGDEGTQKGSEGQPSPDVKTEGEGGQPASDVKVPYTPEELTKLMVEDGDIDTSRLSIEGQALMKAMQRGFTPKLEAAAEERRRIEAEKRELEDEKRRANDPQEALYHRYCQNPTGVIQQINGEIKKLATISPHSEDFAEAQKAIIDLQSFKEELSLRRQTELESSRNLDVVKDKVRHAILQEIPDFDEKAEKLTEHAMGMGYTIEEIRFMSDPMKVGTLAFKFTKTINDLYTKANAGKTAEKKEVKPSPKPLARGGASKETPSNNEVDPSKMTNAEYRSWRKKQG